MSQQDLEFVTQFQAVVLGSEDIKPLLNDDQLWAALGESEMVDLEAEIRFVGPEGAQLGAMLGPFHGVDGLRAGFREWLDPWEEFRIQPVQTLDVGDGRVLSLVEQRGRMKGGAEVTQPSASITHVRDGTIVAIDFYLDQNLARHDAGMT